MNVSSNQQLTLSYENTSLKVTRQKNYVVTDKNVIPHYALVISKVKSNGELVKFITKN